MSGTRLKLQGKRFVFLLLLITLDFTLVTGW